MKGAQSDADKCAIDHILDAQKKGEINEDNVLYIIENINVAGKCCKHENAFRCHSCSLFPVNLRGSSLQSPLQFLDIRFKITHKIRVP